MLFDKTTCVTIEKNHLSTAPSAFKKFISDLSLADTNLT